MYNIIKNYVDKLNISDVNNFASKNNIYLSKEELDVVFYSLKNNLDFILKDSDKVFNNIKNKLSNENYHKIYNLFNEYKKRYKNYL